MMTHAFPRGPSLRRSLNDELLDRLLETEQRIRAAHQTHLGSPYNLSFGPGVPPTLQHFLINNLGDPHSGSTYGSQVFGLEREAMSWLMRLWGCVNLDDYWGTICASGTDGNFCGINLGREALPDAVLLHSASAHSSVPRAAHLQRIDAVEVASNPAGEIDLAALATTVSGLEGRPLILVLTCGTTMTGAHDDITGALAVLDAAGLDRDRRYVHVDGSLNAMVVPFLNDAPETIRPTFEVEVDSISTSGHKMIGTPMPCGALVARKVHVDRITRQSAHLQQNDPLLIGSRNGHAVLSIWTRLFGHGYGGYAHDALACALRAEALAGRLRASGKPVLCNPHSLTVVVEKPSAQIVSRYQLATHKGLARAVVMPNVTDDLMDRFLTDYLNWTRWSLD